MGPDGVWQRIRWGNVARLTALVALGVVVAVWPRLRGGPPPLPPATAVPLGGVDTTGGGETDGRRAPAEEQRAAERRDTKQPRAPDRRDAKAKQPAAHRHRDPAAEPQRRRAPAERRREPTQRPSAPAKPPPAEPPPARRQPAEPPPARRQPANRPPAGPPRDPAAAEFGLP